MFKITLKNLKNLKEKKHLSFFDVIILPLMSFLSIMTAFNGVKNYLRFDVVSQTRSIEKIPLLFPTITICNLDTFATAFAKALSFSLDQIMHKCISNKNTCSTKDFEW